MEATRFSDDPVDPIYQAPVTVNGRKWVTFPGTGSIDLRFSQNDDGTWQAGFLGLDSGKLTKQFAVSEMTNGDEVNERLRRMFGGKKARAASGAWDDGMPIEATIAACRQAGWRVQAHFGLTATATSTWDAKHRKAAADKGVAMPDGSFPIRDRRDLEKAIKALGRAKDPAKARRHIRKRAKALGAESALPDSW